MAGGATVFWRSRAPLAKTASHAGQRNGPSSAMRSISRPHWAQRTLSTMALRFLHPEAIVLACWRGAASLVLVVRHLRLADDLLLNVAGHDVVVAEVHGVGPLPLRDRAELGGVAHHFGERGLADDHGQV